MSQYDSVFSDPYETPVSDVRVWRLPLWAKIRFAELLTALESVTEGSDEHYAIVDQVKALPGFPIDHDPETELIVLEVSDQRY